MNWNRPFELGIKIGWMVSQMEALGHEELERRAAKLPEETRRVYTKLKHTQTVGQLWREANLEEITALAAAILEISEETMQEQLDQVMEAARDRIEAEGLPTFFDPE